MVFVESRIMVRRNMPRIVNWNPKGNVGGNVTIHRELGVFSPRKKLSSILSSPAFQLLPDSGNRTFKLVPVENVVENVTWSDGDIKSATAIWGNGKCFCLISRPKS